MTSAEAWERLLCKCSPSKKALFSPIRPGQHLVGLSTIVFKPHIWILFNTEEFYYQNTNLLVYHSFKDIEGLSLLLRDKWNPLVWEDRLKDPYLIAQGGFGQVYIATDEVTNTRYALKKILPPKVNEDLSFYKFSSNLLQERNIFLELNQSPFFVRILAAFQSSVNTSFWFVLDFCLGDLRRIIGSYPYIHYFDILSADYLEGSSWEKVAEIMNSLWSTKYIDLVFIYLFEMLCSLHYLATKHIVHADIKPENFLISTEGHLKLTDFGVSFRNDWFYRNSIVLLPETVEDLSMGIEKDMVVVNRGTLIYYDPEQHIQSLKLDDLESFERLSEELQSSKYFSSLKDLQQSFLSDLYSVGLITLELITGGLQIAEESLMPSISEEFWNIEMIYNDRLRKLIFKIPLSRLPCDKYNSTIFEFLVSIFKPRLLRAQKYRSETTVFQQNTLENTSHIDITKIEGLLYYQSKQMTKENVQAIIFPKEYINHLVALSEPSGKPKIKIFSETEDQKRAFKLHPFEFTSRTL